MIKKLNSTGFKLFFTVWIIYTFFLTGYGGSYISDDILYQTMSIVDKGSFQIDDYLKPGCKLTGCDLTFYNGHFYSGFAPGTSFIALPLYIILKPFFDLIPESFLGYPQTQLKTILLTIFSTIFIAALLSAISSVLIYKFSFKRTKSKKYSILLALTFSFGTLAFFYSTSFYPRAISASLLLISFFLISESKNLSNKRLIFSGFLAGFAALTNLPVIFISLLILLYTFTRLKNKRTLFFLIGLSIPILLFLFYNFLVYDDPFTTSYTYRVADLKEPPFEPENFGKTLLEYTLLPKFGIFIYSPIFLISLLGIYFGIKNRQYRKETIFLTLAFLSQLIFYSLFPVKDVCSFGLRYIIPAIPFMILLIIYTFTKVKSMYILILSIISILFNLLGPMFYTTCTKGHLFNFYFPQLFNRGFSNYTLNLISLKLIPLNPLLINFLTLLGFVIIAIILWFIWKK